LEFQKKGVIASVKPIVAGRCFGYVKKKELPEQFFRMPVMSLRTKVKQSPE
jgi:hypothetical protein